MKCLSSMADGCIMNRIITERRFINMSTISSKQGKRHGFVDPISTLVLVCLILAFLVLEPLSSNTYSSISDAPKALSNGTAGLAANKNASFASDQRYWNTNCSHGWSSNSSCEDIVLRAQSCTISLDSAYCSEYDTYLHQFIFHK